MARLETITGKAISGEWGDDDRFGTGIPVLRTTNFTNDGVLNFTNVVTRTITKKNVSDKYLRSGDIIIEKSGGSDKQPVGRVVYYSGKPDTYLFNNFTGVLRVIDSSCWDSKYLFYALYANYLKGGTRKYQNQTTGLHNLKTDQYIKEFEVPEYSIQEQKQITVILDKISRLIVLRKQQLAKLDELVKARFVELFGDPAGNPFGWPSRPLLEMGYCKNGLNFHTGDRGIKMHCLGVGDFRDNSVIDGTDHLPMISLNEAPPEESMLRDGDIVFVRSNGNKALVGRCLAVYPRETPTTYSGFCIRYRLTGVEVNTIYLLHILKTGFMREKMAGRGANIQNLNQQILAALDIPVPPMELQQQFAAFVEQAGQAKALIQKSLDRLETLKKSLMQEYFA